MTDGFSPNMFFFSWQSECCIRYERWWSCHLEFQWLYLPQPHGQVYLNPTCQSQAEEILNEPLLHHGHHFQGLKCTFSGFIFFNSWIFREIQEMLQELALEKPGLISCQVWLGSWSLEFCDTRPIRIYQWFSVANKHRQLHEIHWWYFKKMWSVVIDFCMLINSKLRGHFPCCILEIIDFPTDC